MEDNTVKMEIDKLDKESEITSKKKKKEMEDFSEKVAAFIPTQVELAKQGKLDVAIENLLAMEKQTRQGEDNLSTSKLAVAIVKLCFEAKNFRALNDNLVLLAKRRGQLRTVVQDFVQEAMSYLDNLDFQEKMKLLETLRTITEGKMYVEIERARLTRILAKIKEDEGKVGEAADILQEIQVETFGQMDKKEKTDFILEQIRLCLKKKDTIKTTILANKVSRRLLNDPEMQDLKIRFYELLIDLYSVDNKYLDICRSYQAIYDTPKVQENDQAWPKCLQLMVLYICLAPHDNEQSDLINRISEDKKLEKIPKFKKILTQFLTKEIMRWPQFQETFANDINQFEPFKVQGENGNPLWQDLRKRVIEHNIRVLEGYYRRITMKRLSQLLDLPVDEAEKYVSDLVVNKSIFAKIDRPAGIITFRKTQDPAEFLNGWSESINGLLKLLEETCHLVHRENMVQKIVS